LKCELQPYRHADKFLLHWPHWHEFLALASTISAEQVERTQVEVLGGAPVGAQRAINVLFESLLSAEKGWSHQVPVYRPQNGLPDRKMDFWKDFLGIEIAFNNDSYLERIVLRLNAANATDPTLLQYEVAVGVVVVASQALKSWGSMDPSVTTFEGARRTIGLMQPSFSVPLMLVGLFLDKPPDSPSGAFGTKKRVRVQEEASLRSG
jgi:hypothetical protein